MKTGSILIDVLPAATMAPIPASLLRPSPSSAGWLQPQITPLAPREQQIVELISRGWIDKKIAIELGMSVRTVRTHLERLYRKRCLHTRAEAVALWIHAGMRLPSSTD
jgi:DNA-binding NarL/FixJ family response regulator